VILLIL